MSPLLVQLTAVVPGGALPLDVPDGADPVLLFEGGPPGVYTGLRTVGGDRFLALDDHLERLAESVERAGIALPGSMDAIRRSLAAACVRWRQTGTTPDARVLVEVLAEPGPLHASARAFVVLWPFEPPAPSLYRQGVRVALADPSVRRANPRTKASSWRTERLEGATDEAAYEHLLQDALGRLLEGFTTNAHVLRGGRVWSAEEGVLRGITRKLLVRVFGQMGLDVVAEPYPVAALGQAEELGISSSSRGLLPVVQVDGLVVGDGVPGPVFAEAQRRYEALVASESRPAWPR